MGTLFEGLVIPFVKQEGLHLFEYPPDYNPQENWVHRYISWPRKYTEWMTLIDSFRKPIFGSPTPTTTAAPAFVVPLPPPPPYIPNTVPDVWFHRHIAADMMEYAFLRNQWIRGQMQRVLMFLRGRIMARRIIGLQDVGTLEAIPPSQLVRVQDWRTKSTYHFHVDTIHRHIVGALRYQSMALSMPQIPKNPYTNLPWSVGQLLVLYDQMHGRMWSNGRRFMDPVTQAFYVSQLSMDRFRILYGSTLDVDCARRFFHDHTSDYWELLYTEALQDMFTFLHPAEKFRIQALIVDRSLPADLLRQWDNLVFAFWCYDNLNRMVLADICSVYELVEEARKVLLRTSAHIDGQRKKTRIRRNGQRDSE